MLTILFLYRSPSRTQSRSQSRTHSRTHSYSEDKKYTEDFDDDDVSDGGRTPEQVSEVEDEIVEDY